MGQGLKAGGVWRQTGDPQLQEGFPVIAVVYFFSFLLYQVVFAARAFHWLSQVGATLQLQGTGFSLRWLLLLLSRTEVSVAASLRLWSTGSVIAAPGT